MQNVVRKSDRRYPKLLKRIKSAPKKLYYKGGWDTALFKNCLAVVGSRKLTHYGKRAIEQIVGEIAMSGVTIVSGFMYGGDAAAHAAAVKAGGRTIAVMPCGIERIHPEYQGELYQDILDNKGLIISEYDGDMQPELWTYPQRNRIVAGLCQAILVVEAGLKSGSLITADYSKKFKRRIFALPGPVSSSVSKGTNLLIKEGAEMVLESRDVLRFFKDKGGFCKPPLCLRAKKGCAKPVFVASSGDIEEQILEELKREPLTADELARNLGFSASELGTKLSLMQIQRMVKQEGSRYYIPND